MNRYYKNEIKMKQITCVSVSEVGLEGVSLSERTRPVFFRTVSRCNVSRFQALTINSTREIVSGFTKMQIPSKLTQNDSKARLNHLSFITF